MPDIEKLEEQFKQACLVATQTLRASLELLGSPYCFHKARTKSRTRRLSESVRFCGLASTVMVLLYFVTVSAVVDIKKPTTFLLAGSLLNFGHMLVIGTIYTMAGKVVTWKTPARVHFENVFYASALLPLVAFLSQPVAHAQLTSMLADHSDFTFGYRPAIANALANSILMAWSHFGIALSYLYFAYFIYVGLRVTASLSRWRTVVAVIPATMGLFLYQSVVLLPATQQFVHAMTR